MRVLPKKDEKQNDLVETIPCGFGPSIADPQ